MANEPYLKHKLLTQSFFHDFRGWLLPFSDDCCLEKLEDPNEKPLFEFETTYFQNPAVPTVYRISQSKDEEKIGDFIEKQFGETYYNGARINAKIWMKPWWRLSVGSTASAWLRTDNPVFPNISGQATQDFYLLQSAIWKISPYFSLIPKVLIGTRKHLDQSLHIGQIIQKPPKSRFKDQPTKTLAEIGSTLVYRGIKEATLYMSINSIELAKNDSSTASWAFGLRSFNLVNEGFKPYLSGIFTYATITQFLGQNFDTPQAIFGTRLIFPLPLSIDLYIHKGFLPGFFLGWDSTWVKAHVFYQQNDGSDSGKSHPYFIGLNISFALHSQPSHNQNEPQKILLNN